MLLFFQKIVSLLDTGLLKDWLGIAQFSVSRHRKITSNTSAPAQSILNTADPFW